MKKAILPLLAVVSFSTLPAMPVGAEVLVTHGDAIQLTDADLDAAIRNLPDNAREQARTNPKSATAALEAVMLTRVLAKQARAMGLADDPVVRAQVEQASDRVLAIRRMDAFEASLKVPDYTEAAREHYELNKTKYLEPEQVHVAHLLVARQGKDVEAARKLANEALEKAMAGDDFAKLVEQYSDDRGSKPRGGDLGFFARGRMVKEFEQAAFAMEKPGEISKVVESAFGFHVLKFIERKPERQKPFDEVKEQIVAPMRAKFVNAEKLRLTSAIRNDPSIKLNTAAIDKAMGVKADEKPASPAPGK